MTEGIQPPEKIIAPQPRYTHAARRACIEGLVILEAVVDTNGNVVTAQILKDLPSGLGKAAQRAVREWQYEPARLPNGEPVAVYFTFTINFSVDGECTHSERPLVLTPVDTPRPEVGDLTGHYTAVLVIGKKGNVKAVETVFATDPRLKKPIRRTLRKWRYEPPVDPETGRKTRAETTVSFDF